MNIRYCIAITLLSSFLISSCGDSSFTTDWTDVGYSDGYAVGDNTTCEFITRDDVRSSSTFRRLSEFIEVAERFKNHEENLLGV